MTSQEKKKFTLEKPNIEEISVEEMEDQEGLDNLEAYAADAPLSITY
jgi:hypothetical protein